MARQEIEPRAQAAAPLESGEPSPEILGELGKHLVRVGGILQLPRKKAVDLGTVGPEGQRRRRMELAGLQKVPDLALPVGLPSHGNDDNAIRASQTPAGLSLLMEGA
jgi:hypothetical protein